MYNPKPNKMKHKLMVLVISCISVSMLAQVESMTGLADSVMIEKVADLEKQVSKLKNSSWSLQKKLNQHEEQLNSLKEGIEQGKLSTEQANQAIEQLKSDLASHQAGTEERFASNEDRVKKMFLWMIIILGALFLVVLILSIVNRRRINEDYLKLEAKVDNTREAIELEVKEVLKNHEKDMEEIKAAIEELKK